jgi:hypothetical protein
VFVVSKCTRTEAILLHSEMTLFSFNVYLIISLYLEILNFCKQPSVLYILTAKSATPIKHPALWLHLTFKLKNVIFIL